MAKKLQSQTVVREKLDNAISYKKIIEYNVDEIETCFQFPKEVFDELHNIVESLGFWSSDH